MDIRCKSTTFFAVLQINVIFCYIFLPKNLHISVIFCNFAPDFKNTEALWNGRTLNFSAQIASLEMCVMGLVMISNNNLKIGGKK